jgi:hypothetical protein
MGAAAGDSTAVAKQVLSRSAMGTVAGGDDLSYFTVFPVAERCHGGVLIDMRIDMCNGF